MVDTSLMFAVMKAVPPNSGLLLVGDVDQLPSVGPGQVLGDIIGAGVIQVARLTEVFRQAAESRIVVNAHRINRGEMPEWPKPGEDSDFWFVDAEDPEKGAAKVVEIVRDRIPRRFRLDPVHDVQVLCPMQRARSALARSTAISKTRSIRIWRKDRALRIVKGSAIVVTDEGLWRDFASIRFEIEPPGDPSRDDFATFRQRLAYDRPECSSHGCASATRTPSQDSCKESKTRNLFAIRFMRATPPTPHGNGGISPRVSRNKSRRNRDDDRLDVVGNQELRLQATAAYGRHAKAFSSIQSHTRAKTSACSRTRWPPPGTLKKVFGSLARSNSRFAELIGMTSSSSP